MSRHQRVWRLIREHQISRSKVESNFITEDSSFKFILVRWATMFVSWLKIETDWKMQINVFHCDTYLNMFSHPALFLSLSGHQVLSIACVMLPVIWCNGHTFSFMRLWISLCGSHRPFCLFLHISIGIIHIPGSVLIFFYSWFVLIYWKYY